MRFLGIFCTAVLAVLLSADLALAEAAAEATANAGSSLGAFGAAIGIGIAAFGGALGQSKVIASTVESISRNPGAAGQMFLPWLLALVLIESLVIYALLVAFRLS